MMENTELIKALRTCADHNAVGDKCYGECPYNGNYNECVDQMILDAADALEADEKRIAELLPKEGAWIQMNGHRYCNVCGHKDSPILTNYCPNCGAKMRTVTDCHTLDERRTV